MPHSKKPRLCWLVERFLEIAIVLVLDSGFSLSSFAEVRTPYTEADLRDAVPMGVPGARAWADAPLSVLQQQITRLPTFEGSGVFSILALFELGRDRGRLGGNWEHFPPRLYR